MVITDFAMGLSGDRNQDWETHTSLAVTLVNKVCVRCWLVAYWNNTFMEHEWQWD